MSSLQKRFLTALVLISFVILGIFFTSEQIFKLLLTLVLSIGAWEWASLMGCRTHKQRIGILALIVAFILLTHYFAEILILPVGVIFWFISAFFIIAYPRYSGMWANSVVLAVVGMLIFATCWNALWFLRDTLGPMALMVLLLLVWTTDIGAYFVGRLWGKTKLAPVVSPGKTVEGAGGGIVCGLMLASAVYFLGLGDALGVGLAYWLLLAFLTILASIIGDLFVSMLKRKQAIKDTGSLLPGHGGLLDRIDSLLAAAPIFVLGLFFVL